MAMTAKGIPDFFYFVLSWMINETVKNLFSGVETRGFLISTNNSKKISNTYL